MSKSGRKYSEYDKQYQARPEQVAKRVARNKARRHALKNGTVHKGDGKDMHHPAGNAKGRAVATTASHNRAMKPSNMSKPGPKPKHQQKV